MTTEKKAEWTKAYDAERAAVATFIAKDKTASGYSVMTTEQKTLYDAELLKWMQAVFEVCQKNAKALAC